jgi:hypothetical protein
MRTRKILYVLLALLASIPMAHAQELAPYEVVPDGREYGIRMGTNERSLKAISVYFVSTGNVSNKVEVAVQGPASIVGTARAGFLGGQGAAQALSISTAVQSVLVRSYEKKKGMSSFSPVSYGYSDAYANVSFHIQKDACAPATSKYVAQVKLDLSGIDPALYDQGFTISIAVKESPFKGKKVASIKPSSDGKYYGEPILLMETVGWGGEYVNKVTWKGGRIVATKRLPIVKYVSYRGYGLSLARIKGILNGGKHTFELSSSGSDEVYGVCLKAVRARQRINGYPG